MRIVFGRWMRKSAVSAKRLTRKQALQPSSVADALRYTGLHCPARSEDSGLSGNRETNIQNRI
uniref:Uncharacterized protein n=1 Tax=Magnetococcus massalia (strain MO-1) TaxID=451514 RepID=A0A1S7LHE7_MAGMO|nr:protein of unknown function [Candidatus Magnetococcus massalia]